MRHFATEAGKNKGQFYTSPRGLANHGAGRWRRQGTLPAQTIYDLTCGSGSLLLKAAGEAPRGVTIYGQEMDNSTWALARMNMIPHGHETAEICSAPGLVDRAAEYIALAEAKRAHAPTLEPRPSAMERDTRSVQP